MPRTLSASILRKRSTCQFINHSLTVVSGKLDTSRPGPASRKEHHPTAAEEEQEVNPQHLFPHPLTNLSKVDQNIKFENFTFQNSKYIFAIGQCTTYSFNFGDCDSSTMAISNFSVGPLNGTSAFETTNVRLHVVGRDLVLGLRLEVGI